MAASNNTIISRKLILSGRLFDHNNEPLPILLIHIYYNDHLISCFQTSSNGNFVTTTIIETPENSLSQYDLVLKRCNSDNVEIAELTYSINPDPYNNAYYVGNISFSAVPQTEDVPVEYTFNIVKTVVKSKLTEFWGDVRNLFTSKTSAEVQAMYGFGSVPLTSQNTFKMLLNGICPIYFKYSNGDILAEVNWDNYNFDKLRSLPNTRLYFKVGNTANDLPTLVRMELEYRKTLNSSSSPSDKEPVRVYTPTQPNFETKLRVANSAFAIFGEVVFHLGMGHVYGARFAEHYHEYLIGTALEGLLGPHCNYIRKITFEIGNDTVTGQHGVLNLLLSMLVVLIL